MKDTLAEALGHFAHLTEAADLSPRVLIDNHCNVLWRSPQADRLLRPPLPLWIENDRLHATGGGSAQAWPSFVEGAGEGGERLLLTGRSESSWVLVRGWGAWHDEQRLIFVQCATSRPLRSVAGSGLGEDFGLTRSECAVLDQFATLAKPDEIGRRLNISVSTVRSHLKQIHAKMSVSSSVQLLQITRAYTDN